MATGGRHKIKEKKEKKKRGEDFHLPFLINAKRKKKKKKKINTPFQVSPSKTAPEEKRGWKKALVRRKRRKKGNVRDNLPWIFQEGNRRGKQSNSLPTLSLSLPGRKEKALVKHHGERRWLTGGKEKKKKGSIRSFHGPKRNNRDPKEEKRKFWKKRVAPGEGPSRRKKETYSAQGGKKEGGN